MPLWLFPELGHCVGQLPSVPVQIGGGYSLTVLLLFKCGRCNGLTSGVEAWGLDFWEMTGDTDSDGGKRYWSLAERLERTVLHTWLTLACLHF